MCVTSESGHSKPRARLRRAQRERHRCIRHRRSHLCVSGTRCALLRRLPSRVAVSQSHAAVVRGKWASPIQHNRALFEVAPVARGARLVGQPLRCAPRPAGSHNERLCLAPRPSAARTVLPCVLKPKSVCSRQQPRQHMRLVTRCAPVCMSHAPARPAVAVARLALRCSFPRARARSRPPPQGAPLTSKAKSQTQALERLAGQKCLEKRANAGVCAFSA